MVCWRRFVVVVVLVATDSKTKSSDVHLPTTLVSALYAMPTPIS